MNYIYIEVNGRRNILELHWPHEFKVEVKLMITQKKHRDNLQINLQKLLHPQEPVNYIHEKMQW